MRTKLDDLLALRHGYATYLDTLTPALERCAALTCATEEWLVDELTRRFPASMHASFEVLALGSFGRKELCLHSDLDLLFYVHDASLVTHVDFVEALTLVMKSARDARLKFKHAVRTPAQHAEELLGDWRTPVAMLDASPIQFIPPSTKLADTLRAQARAHLDTETFLDLLIQAHIERRDRQNQSVYLLEPDLKAGLGGLRDLHTLHWASQVRFQVPAARLHAPELGWGDEEREGFARALNWLLDLRWHLHSMHPRAQDRLRFAEQRTIAARLYPNHSNPIEHLMHTHYSMTRQNVKRLDRTLRQWGPEPHTHNTLLTLTTDSPQAFARTLTPHQCFDALRQASTRSLMLGPQLEAQITRSVDTWTIPANPDAQAALCSILCDLHMNAHTSSRLLDLGLLTHFVPEFSKLVCHVQYDTYHVYTTDVHSLKCLERARAMLHAPQHDTACQRWSAFPKIAEHIAKPRVFLLAALLHDIGKNRGGDHSNKGADLIPHIARRFGLADHEAQRLELLVREHLLLSNTSRRRDITDPLVHQDIIDRIHDRRTLIELTCLTFCDMSTVSTTAMNDWRSSLLLQLHHHVAHALKGRPSKQDSTLRTFARGLPVAHREAAIAFLGDLPEERLTHIPHKLLFALFQAYQELVHDSTRTAVGVHTITPRTGQHVIVATREQPGALAKIAGVLSAQGLTILSADIMSTSSGRVLDLFHVAPVQNTPREHAPLPELSSHRIAQLTAQLRDVLDAGQPVEHMLARRFAQQRIAHREMPAVETKVRGYSDASEDYSIIEVHAPDRPGLLYDIARALHDRDIDVRLSKLDMLGNQAIDTFYVESMFSGKLTPEQLAALTQELLNILQHTSPAWTQEES